MRVLQIIKNRVGFWLGLLGLASMLFSCSFENDAKYNPQKRASVFLVQDSLANRTLLKWEPNGTVLLDWHKQLGLTDVAAMAGDAPKGQIWLCEPAAKKIIIVDVVSGTVASTIYPPITPHIIAVGFDKVCVADTVLNKLWFREKAGRQRSHEVSLQEQPRLLAANTAKFYVATKSSVMVYSEEAMAPRLVNSLPFPLYAHDCAFDILKNAHITYYSAQADTTKTRYRNTVSATGDIASVPQITNTAKTRFTPYYKAAEETEYLQNVELKNGTVTAGIVSVPAQDFSMDFRASQLFVFRNDSISIFNPKTAIRLQQVYSRKIDYIVNDFHLFTPLTN
jgi:hypothetical protein